MECNLLWVVIKTMMLEQQFTEKTQELLGHAQFKAHQAQHPEVGEDHLLIALIEKDTQVLPTSFRAYRLI